MLIKRAAAKRQLQVFGSFESLAIHKVVVADVPLMVEVGSLFAMLPLVADTVFNKTTISLYLNAIVPGA